MALKKHLGNKQLFKLFNAKLWKMLWKKAYF